MKATNLILIVAFLAFATTGFTTNDLDPRDHPVVVKISLEKATANEMLVKLMYQQLNPDFVKGPKIERIIMAKVTSRFAVYVIYGELDQWRKFFGKLPVADKKL